MFALQGGDQSAALAILTSIADLAMRSGEDTCPTAAFAPRPEAQAHAQALNDAFATIAREEPGDFALRCAQLDFTALRETADVIVPLAESLLIDAVASSDVAAAEAAWRWIRDFAISDLTPRARALPLLNRLTGTHRHRDGGHVAGPRARPRRGESLPR
jgi:hypothetical protein